MIGVLYLSEIEFKLGLRRHYYIVLICRGRKQNATEQPATTMADPSIDILPLSKVWI